jgi:hypothetical protein
VALPFSEIDPMLLEEELLFDSTIVQPLQVTLAPEFMLTLPPSM